MELPVQLLPTARGDRIAYCVHRLPKAHTTVLFCPGLLSSMHGLKGERLQRTARELGCSYAALEYRGQGRSEGAFLDCTLQDWIDDVVQVVDQVTPGASHILVGSSLGAWLALHAALTRPEAVQALLLIAPAVDISQCWERFGVPATPKPSSSQQGAQPGPRELLTIHSSYIEGGMTLRRSFIEEANARHLLLSGVGGARLGALHCPVHILYSERDDAVPAEIPRRLAGELRESSACPLVELQNIPDGDHRLSRDSDLDRMARALRTLCRHVGGAKN